MNQIPNIEDLYTKIDDYYRNNFDESQPRKKMFITELLHHQLQKAREEERERIAKVVNELMPILYSEDAERHASNIRLANNLNIILQALTNKES